MKHILKFKALLVILLVSAIGFSLVSSTNSFQLADTNDTFAVLSPRANSNVKGTININFRLHDDDNPTTDYSVKLYDAQSCYQTFYGNIATGTINNSGGASQTYTVQWNTNTTQSNSALADGNYCLQVCTSMLNDSVPYSACNSRIVTTINNNSLPTITSSPTQLVFNEGEIFQYQVTATDSDNDVLTYRLVTTPGFITINPQTGLITSQPLTTGGNESISYPVRVIVSDGKSGEVQQDFIITINQVEQQPQPQPDPEPQPDPVIDNTPPVEQDDEQPPIDNDVDKGDVFTGEFRFLSPQADEIIDSDNILIQWIIENTIGLNNITLEYSTDESNWIEISNSVDVNRNYYLWNISEIEDNEYYLRMILTGSNGENLNQLSEKFIINLGNVGEDQVDEDEGLTEVDNIPLIINTQPENESERTDEFKVAISGDFIPSVGNTILPETFSINVDGRNFVENCEIDENGFLCTPEESLTTGRHRVDVSVEDTSGKTADSEWIFRIVSSSDNIDNGSDESSSDNGETETVELFGREFSRSAVVFVAIILCIATALLFIPWILYSMWTGGGDSNGDEVIENYTVDSYQESYPDVNIYNNAIEPTQTDLDYVEPVQPQDVTINNYNFDNQDSTNDQLDSINNYEPLASSDNPNTNS